jgi:hypothetical protein
MCSALLYGQVQFEQEVNIMPLTAILMPDFAETTWHALRQAPFIDRRTCGTVREVYQKALAQLKTWTLKTQLLFLHKCLSQIEHIVIRC